MSFFLFSRAQKRDTNPNRKFFNLNNKVINNDLNNNIKYRKNILDKDKNNNINYYKENKKNYKTKNINNFNHQRIIVKKQGNSYNIGKKDLIQIISNKKNFSIKENNLKYSLINESLISKEESLKNINYLNYKNKNILNGLFDKFFILNFKKNTYINLIKDKNFILPKLNPIYKFKYNKDNSNLRVKKGINKMNLDI